MLVGRAQQPEARGTQVDCVAGTQPHNAVDQRPSNSRAIDRTEIFHPDSVCLHRNFAVAARDTLALNLDVRAVVATDALATRSDGGGLMALPHSPQNRDCSSVCCPHLGASDHLGLLSES